MAHAKTPAKTRQPGRRFLDQYLTDAWRASCADDAARRRLQRSCRRFVNRHIDTSLMEVQRGKRAHGWLMNLASVTALTSCAGLLLLGSSITAHVAAALFMALYKVASANLASRRRELLDDEARYLTYAAEIAFGRDPVRSPPNSAQT